MNSDRLELLRKLIPEMLLQNGNLKRKIVELEEKISSLTELNRDLASRLSELSSKSDFGDGLILGNFNGKVSVKAGSTQALIEVVCNPNHQGDAVEFMNVFLLTYRNWTDGTSVLDFLCTRLKDVNADLPRQSDKVLVEARKQFVARIFSFILTWIESFFYDFVNDDVLVRKMNAALKDLQGTLEANFLSTLSKAWDRQWELRRRRVAAEQKLAEEAEASLSLQNDDGSEEAQLRLRSQKASRSAEGLSVARLRAIDLRRIMELSCAVNVFSEPAPEPIVPKNAFSKASAAEDLDHLELARQITLLQFQLFIRLEPKELSHQRFSKKDKEKLAPNVVAITDQFNDISNWVTYSVVTVPDLKKRASLLKKMILIGKMRLVILVSSVFFFFFFLVSHLTNLFHISSRGYEESK